MLEIRTHALPTGGFVNTFTDITERYRHAEALRASERWIRLITDQVPALIAYLSDELVYEFTNKVYEGVPLAQRLDARPLPARRAWRRALPASGAVLRAGSGRRKRDLRDRRDRVVRRGALHAALPYCRTARPTAGSPGYSC